MRREEEEEAAAAAMKKEEEEEESVPVVSASPSFRAPFAAFYESRPLPGDGGSKDVAVDDDFEFVVKDPDARQGLAAEEIYSGRQIRSPIYPVFGRAAPALEDGERLESQVDEETEAVQGTLLQLLMEDRAENPGLASSSSSYSASSGMDELEGIPPASYCVWTPSPSASPSPTRCKKSSSTGSSLRWRLRDLVVGRSQSDGKEKFVFLAAEEKKGRGSPSRETKRREAVGKQERTDAGAKSVKAGTDLTTAHRVYYGKGVPAASGAGRRSFLPYKRDLLGFFANVNGITRTHHPF
ncbi:uncharacterized protein LOC122011356 [Zingiber officinale]|uniref:Uncharacterized protein n=1 Tax=Zingiber officinale TaxID=94328 RepID=A0A8J5F7U3_ZINOF|nr:uncharacterized protein LOC122011356 [Zingiber officinale]KAG6484724.1 hypothetical protein ZIOFF_053247 [Zingiber officinale]